MAAAQFSRRTLARMIASKLIAEPSRQKHWLHVLAGHLVEQHREHEADLIIHDIERELYEQDGQLLAHVTSARPLSDTVRAALKKLLQDQTKAKHVTFSEDTDTSLIGGLVARTSDAELDASVRTKLHRLAAIN